MNRDPRHQSGGMADEQQTNGCAGQGANRDAQAAKTNRPPEHPYQVIAVALAMRVMGSAQECRRVAWEGIMPRAGFRRHSSDGRRRQSGDAHTS